VVAPSNGLTFDVLQTREKHDLLPLAPNEYPLISSSYPPEVRTVTDNLSSNESNRLSLSSPVGLWSAILGALEVRVPGPAFDTYLRDTHGVSLENGRLTVRARNAFVVEYLEKRLATTVQETASRVARTPVGIVFVVRPSSHSTGAGPRATGARRVVAAGNRRYTFASFIVGPHNELAYSAAAAAVQAPGGRFSPLLLCSAPGLGKTHLLQSIYTELAQAGLKCVSVTSDQFMADYINAAMKGKSNDFRSKYHSLDALLIDDIQFLRGKKGTQESLYHVFNSLYQRDCQIVLACDHEPTEFSYLEPRLRSRFTSGLTVSLLAPSQPGRLDFLKRRTRHQQIPENVLTALSRPACLSVRDLESRLNRLLARVDLTHRPPTLSLAAAVLAEETLVAPTPIVISAEELISRVASHFGVSPATLCGTSRHRITTRARHCAAWLLRSHCGFSVAEVGRLLGGRDHSTIRQALQKMDDEEQIKGSLTLLRNQILSPSGIPIETTKQ